MTIALETLVKIQSNVNKRAQVFLFAHIFNHITYKLKHQLIRHKNYKQRLDQVFVQTTFKSINHTGINE